MTMLPLFLAALAATLAAQPDASARQDGIGDPQYRACMDPAVAASQMRACGDEWLERLDAQLNAEWRTLLPLVDGDRRTALVAEQRDWIRFKDQSCAYLTEYYGALGPAVQFPSCRAEILSARIAQLRSLHDFLAENR